MSIPRFALLAAAGSRQELLSRPVAIAPEPGGEGAVGVVSGPAEAFGIRAGMRLGEALARCPELVLVPADPERAEAVWEKLLRRLEGIGAAVESERAGEAFFEADGLRGLWGGQSLGSSRIAQETADARVIAKARTGARHPGATGRRADALLRLRGGAAVGRPGERGRPTCSRAWRAGDRRGGL